MQDRWQETGIYRFRVGDPTPVYAIDTPPPTVSGHLHLGHAYSYSHTDFMARFWRMNGHNVFYPMGYDDNGLPTERLVERWHQVRAQDIGREAFIEKCLAVSEEVEGEYEAVWKRLGFSIDWRYSYRTIDRNSRRISQLSFIDLFRRGLVYRQKAPTIWCAECQTAIAQAELDDLQRTGRFYTLDFRLENEGSLPIATTRPELLPACVAIFVHPEDDRFTHLVGSQAAVPYFGHRVPILSDPAADPGKGTGAVMCCTFGDTADVEWWQTYQLPLVEAIGPDGLMTEAAGPFRGLSTTEARDRLAEALAERGQLLGQQSVDQRVRTHERCDTPVEYIVTQQWFVRILDFKDQFLAAGERIQWQPEHMKTRYRQWVENLSWDWCITRQRYFGVTFPVWYCDQCGQVMLADEADLPVDPAVQQPKRACDCGSSRFSAERDVMDTWATSSLTPQIVGQWLTDRVLYETVFPMSLRPQAHEIIRTWAFYTIVKSHYHFNAIPWDTVAISGWGLAPEGSGKISKSRGGGPATPLEMIDRYSADAVRYWAASTGLGRDAIISEERIQAGHKLVTKLWNVARFSQRFLAEYPIPAETPALTPADSWILSRSQQLIQQATSWFHKYDYASAKSEIETFFWRELADNYLEMAKKRLYDSLTLDDPQGSSQGARFALYHALLATVKLLAPLLPFVTEQIYTGLLRPDATSVHTATWPAAHEQWISQAADVQGAVLVSIATAVRRYKSEHNLSLGSELSQLWLYTEDQALSDALVQSVDDIASVTRARRLLINEKRPQPLTPISRENGVHVALLV